MLFKASVIIKNKFILLCVITWPHYIMFWDTHNVALVASKFDARNATSLFMRSHLLWRTHLEMFYDRDSAFLVSIPFSNSQTPNGGNLVQITSWNSPAPTLFTFTSSYVSPSAVLSGARLLVLPDLYNDSVTQLIFIPLLNQTSNCN